MERQMDAEMIALAKDQAAFCSVFANAKRVLIFWYVAKRERSVTEISEEIDASLQSTSQHLHLMKERRVLVSRRQGQTIYYRPAKNELLSQCAMFCQDGNRWTEQEARHSTTVEV
jgi:DNA-binding transcriptional ArsR family regulator